MPRLAISTPFFRAALRPSSASQFVPRCIANTAASTRSFSHLPNLRPTLQSRTPTASIFRQPTLFSPPTTATTTTAEQAIADVTPKSSVTSHPAFAGAMQVRFAPRPTMSGHSRLIQKRRHGFLSRIRTKNGRKMLERRKSKNRSRLSA